MEISTSILSVNKEDAIKTFYNIEFAKTDYFHIDVMDGKFVEKDTSDYMWEFAQTIKHISNVPLDIHLMVCDVNKYVEEYLSLEPTYITVHFESFDITEELKNTIDNIKNSGVKAGISIKPNTDIKEILSFLPFVSVVQVMTVEPGAGGQKLILSTLEKIKKLRKYREENNLNYFIEADGGIKLDNVDLVREAGADIAVAGTAIIESKDMLETIKKLKYVT